MTPAPYRKDTLAGRLPFILTLWLSLGVALLSALVPLGPPSSRFTGSAFNPATTGVVLKARAHATPLTVQAMEPDGDGRSPLPALAARSEEHTSELQSLMRTSYAVFCLKKKHKSVTVTANDSSIRPTTLIYS